MNNRKDRLTTPQHSLIAKLFHWGFAILFIYGIIKQVNDISDLEDFAILTFEIIFATSFLIILVLRFIYMTKTQQSSLPEETSPLQKMAAKIVHFGMYLMLGGIAGSGLLIGILYWMGLKYGLIVDLIIAIHVFFVSASYWLIGLHVLAAIYHRFKNDGVWSSMVPVWTESNSKTQ